MRFINLFIALVVYSLSANAQYKIMGDVKGVPDGTILRLYYVAPKYIPIDSTKVENGKFTLVGGKQEQPKWAILKINNNFVPLADFYLENGEISIKGEMYNIDVSGTPTNEQYKIYNKDINSKFSELSTLLMTKNIEESEVKKDSCDAFINKLNSEITCNEELFLKNYPNSPISIRIIDYRSRFADSKRIFYLLSLLSQQLQQSDECTKIYNYAQKLAKTENGAIAPNFSLPNSKEQDISLSSYKGKYILLDFWASWCAPCRASFPLIAELYEKYKSENFEIIGISLDRKNEDWIKALNSEKVAWPMVIDNKGEIANKYAVLSIPHLVIISPEGKIIGKYTKNDIADVLFKLFNK